MAARRGLAPADQVHRRGCADVSYYGASINRASTTSSTSLLEVGETVMAMPGTEPQAAQGNVARRVVVIVGASSGIGRCLASMCVASSDAVVLVARREELLRQVAAELADAPGSRRRDLEAPIVLAADVRADDVGARVAEATLAAFGRVDVLVYAAGWNVPKRAIGEADAESWRTIIDTNLTGAFHLTSALVPVMRRQGAGLLIYLSSSGAKRADRSGAAYQASKAGVAALAHATMEECRSDGIRTTVIYPGVTDTPFLDHRPAPVDEGTRQHALRAVDVATACRFVMDLPQRAHVPELLLYPTVP
jgi:NADP-dependent 3-hydroxy acid dehydrogenase YdfG